jgi:hypothetical protein
MDRGAGSFHGLSSAAQALLLAASGVLGALIAWRVAARAARALRERRALEARRRQEREAPTESGGGATDGSASGRDAEAATSERRAARLNIWTLL